MTFFPTFELVLFMGLFTGKIFAFSNKEENAVPSFRQVAEYTNVKMCYFVNEELKISPKFCCPNWTQLL